MPTPGIIYKLRSYLESQL